MKGYLISIDTLYNVYCIHVNNVSIKMLFFIQISHHRQYAPIDVMKYSLKQ
ncbi:MAG: hypothetical protein K0R69_2597 [Clostridia bacterium]|nr:hypothetical protein [Clostridia bacterium]